MRITVQKADLLKAIEIVEKAIAKNSTIPILTGILIDAEDGIKLIATNTQVYATAKVNGQTSEIGSVVVDGKLFSQAIKKLGEVISVSVNKEKLEIQSGRSKFSLRILEEAFPDAPGRDGEEAVGEVESSILQRAIRQTVYVTGSDHTRPFTQGIYFNGDAVSTDVNRLAMSALGIEGKFIVPADCTDILLKLRGTVAISKFSDSVVFDDRNSEIIVRLIDATYPDYRRLIPDSSPIEIEVKRQDLFAAIDKASLVSTEVTGINLTLGDNTLTVSMQTGDDYEETLEVDGVGQGTICFNDRFIKEFLKVAETDTVKLSLNTELRPCVIQAGDYKYVLMPIRPR